MAISPEKITTEQEDQLFRLLRQLEIAPEASQRVTAQAIGVSLGRLNALLKQAADTKFIKITDHSGSDKRARYAYEITARGAGEKNRLTTQFLARKLSEYDALHAELTGSTSGLISLNQRTKLMENNLAPIPELYVSYESAQKLKVEAADLVSHDLTPRQICDLELLMNGGFNPLKGFLTEAKPTTTALSTTCASPLVNFGQCQSPWTSQKTSQPPSKQAKTSHCATKRA